MVSPFFDMSCHFVAKDKYRTFFGNLINDAERIYREHLDTFQGQLDSALTPEFFDDVEPLDRPYTLASLQYQLQSKVAQGEATREKLAAELEESKRIQKKQEKQLRNVQAALARRSRKKAAGSKRRKRR
jgi:hypothetical protein